MGEMRYQVKGAGTYLSPATALHISSWSFVKPSLLCSENGSAAVVAAVVARSGKLCHVNRNAHRASRCLASRPSKPSDMAPLAAPSESPGGNTSRELRRSPIRDTLFPSSALAVPGQGWQCWSVRAIADDHSPARSNATEQLAWKTSPRNDRSMSSGKMAQRRGGIGLRSARTKPR